MINITWGTNWHQICRPRTSSYFDWNNNVVFRMENPFQYNVLKNLNLFSENLKKRSPTSFGSITPLSLSLWISRIFGSLIWNIGSLKFSLSHSYPFEIILIFIWKKNSSSPHCKIKWRLQNIQMKSEWQWQGRVKLDRGGLLRVKSPHQNIPLKVIGGQSNKQLRCKRRDVKNIEPWIR